MNFKANKLIFKTLQIIINKLFFNNLILKSRIYDNGWWIKNNLKVLVLGSSFAKCHIIPKVIHKLNPEYKEKEIANFAQSMGGPYEMYITLEKNKKYLKELEYVYIGIDPHIFGEKFYHYMIAEKYLVSYEQWEYLFSKNSKYMENFHPNLKIDSLFPLQFFKDLLKKDYRKNSLYNGYEPRKIFEIKTFEEKKIPEYTFGDLNLFPPSKFCISYLKKIEDLLKRNSKTKIIYFLSPSYDWQVGYEKYCKEYDKQLCKLISKYVNNPNIKGSLYKEVFDLNRFDFSDNRHLSYLGAVKFTKSLFKDIEKTNKNELISLCNYKENLNTNISVNILNSQLLIIKNILHTFIQKKSTLVIYGFNNVSRLLVTIIEEKGLTISICDNNPFLGSLPEFLEDNFILKKKIFHINKIHKHYFDGIIISNISNYKNEKIYLEKLKINKDKILNLDENLLDLSFLQMQINMLFNLFDIIENKFDNITLVGNSILKSFIKERLKEKFLKQSTYLKEENINNPDELYIILDNFEENKKVLTNKYRINIENIIILDL